LLALLLRSSLVHLLAAAVVLLLRHKDPYLRRRTLAAGVSKDPRWSVPAVVIDESKGRAPPDDER